SDQIPVECLPCRCVQRQEPALLELRLTNDEPVRGHVIQIQCQGFGDPPKTRAIRFRRWMHLVTLSPSGARRTSIVWMRSHDCFAPRRESPAEYAWRRCAAARVD